MKTSRLLKCEVPLFEQEQKTTGVLLKGEEEEKINVNGCTYIHNKKLHSEQNGSKLFQFIRFVLPRNKTLISDSCNVFSEVIGGRVLVLSFKNQ